MLEHGAAGLFLKPGLRKTSCTLAAVKVLKKQNLINRVLVIAPLRVCHLVWPVEVKKWKDFNHFEVVVLHGPKKEELLKKDADIYVINPEGLTWLFGAENVKTPTGRPKLKIDKKRLKSLGFDLLIVDELSWFKHSNTARFKLMKQVIGSFSRRWGLTGDPSANGLMDLFGQCYILDQGRSLGEYISHYRKKYFEQDYTGYDWTLREGADKEIYKRIKPLVLSMGDEYLKDLPEIVEHKIMVDLPEKAFKVYLEVEDVLISKIEEGLVSAANAAVASSKCRQIASGGVYINQEVEALSILPTNKRDWADLHNEKLSALESLLVELQGSPLLIAYEFDHELEKFKKKFGKDLPYIGGGVSMKKATALVDQWNAGKLPYLFGQPASMGHGLNLQESSCNVCWYTQTWSYDKDDQFVRRVRRSGNINKHVFVYRILARNTIDEIVYFALQKKKKGQQALFDALKLRGGR